MDLSGGNADEETERNRESGLGALSGYVVGLGTAYGLVRTGIYEVFSAM